MKQRISAIIAGLLLGASAALAQVPTPPQVQQINPTDLFQDIPLGAPGPQNFYAPALLLGNYFGTLPGGNQENTLIAGDFSSNLFAYGTSVSTISTSSTYVANRWFAWSGTGTAISGAQETGASDIPTGFEASLRITRTGTGVKQACVGQVVESINSYRYQGQTAEFDAHMLAGAGLSSASDAVAMYIVYGTGIDEGSAKMAFGINGGNTGNASAGWTGQVNQTALVNLSSGGYNRFTFVANVPTTATEVGVALCYTPVGTNVTNDYFDFTGALLTPNSALTTGAGATGAALTVNDPRAKSTVRRPIGYETLLQERYHIIRQETEGGGSIFGTCEVTTIVLGPQCTITIPTPMRTTPTLTYTAGNIKAFVGSSGAPIAVSNMALTSGTSGLALGPGGATSANVTATLATAGTAGVMGYLEAYTPVNGGQIILDAEE